MDASVNFVARTNKGLKHFNTLVPRLRKLESRHALDQLIGLAKHLCQQDFLAWIAYVFGFDIEPETCEKLRQALLNDSVPNPPIEIVAASQIKGHHGAYNKKLKTIFVAEEAVDPTVDEDGEDAILPNWKLMIILVEEFGHHIDNLLRTEYSSIGGDAPLDEGAKFAYEVVHFDYDRTQKKHYANYKELGLETKLYVDYKKFNEAVEEYLSEEEILDDDKSGDEEYFGSGRNRDIAGISFGHESIEDTLEKAGFDKIERKKIYVGNWERDYSQLIVPILVRGPKETLFFKRKTLTDIVNVLCELHFGRNFHKVTEASLGVYLPEHHIDNPKGIDDGRADDPEFRDKWTQAEIEIDTVRGMKNYIATSGRGWVTATDMIKKEINMALFKGRTDEGLRQLGRALHIVEDYFAHSNFVEVTLIKLGYKVYPWVPIPPRGKIPITTGVFGFLDTAATIAAAVGEILQRDEPFEAGERTTGQKITLILMRDRFPNMARYYEAYLNAVEEFKKKHPLIWEILFKTVGQIRKWLLWLIGAFMRKCAEIIHEAQNAFDSDPNSTDPTHTQIAKDHDDHHFHIIAAKLAAEAVRQIGEAVVRKWNWKPSATGEVGIILFPKARYKYADMVLAERTKLDAFVKDIEARAKDGDTIVLVGHASAEGNDVYNQFLSEQRGLTVEDYLKNNIKKVKVNFSNMGIGARGAAANAPEWRRTNVEISSTGTPVDPVALAVSFLVHPNDTNWMDKMVKDWAEANPNAIKRGMSRTFTDHFKKEIEEKTAPWMQKANQTIEQMMKWLDKAEEQFNNFFSPKDKI